MIPASGRIADASMRRRIWRLAIFACGTLAVFGALLTWSVDRDRQANAWVSHTHTVLGMVAAYTREIVDAETGQRGYLLTRQASYLLPYNNALADNRARLGQLRAVIVNDDEPRKLQRLSEIFHDKLDELALTIALARSGNTAGALAIVREGRGRRDTVEFRRLGGEIAAGEYVLLQKQQEAAAFEDRMLQIGIAIGGTLAILLIIVATERTVARIEARAVDLLRAIKAVAGGHLDQRVQTNSRDGIGKIAQSFNAMADSMLAARKARERAETDLADAHKQVMSEVAERRAAEARLFRTVAELKRSNDELDNFAYSASHDLKAPLRGIRNLAEWIAADVQDVAGDETRENLALLSNRVERLDLLLDSLLQYSRVGRTGGTPEDIDIAQLVGEIAAYVAPGAGLAVICRPGLPALHTNKAPLEQVLRNLIGNALKHHDRDTGTVIVSARNIGDSMEFRVADDGPGIAPAFHDRIFQMFQTLKSRDQVEGSGMGLAIVKKSVEGHGGTIRIESAPPRRGTTFVFTWPKNRQALAA